MWYKRNRSHPNVHNEHQPLDLRQVVVVGQAQRLARTQGNICSGQREGETARENYFREPVCSVGKVDSNLKERRKLFLWYKIGNNGSNGMGTRCRSNNITWKSSNVQTIKNPRQLFETLLTSNRDLMTSLTQPQNEPDWAAGTCFISERCLFGTVFCIVRSSIKGTRGVKRLMQSYRYKPSGGGAAG